MTMQEAKATAFWLQQELVERGVDVTIKVQLITALDKTQLKTVELTVDLGDDLFGQICVGENGQIWGGAGWGTTFTLTANKGSMVTLADRIVKQLPAAKVVATATKKAAAIVKRMSGLAATPSRP